jgi:hypothetical protein
MVGDVKALHTQSSRAASLILSLDNKIKARQTKCSHSLARPVNGTFGS